MSPQEHRAWRASKGPCGIDGCDGLYMARGYCQSHYKRLLKYGDPLGEPAPRPKKVKEPKPPRVRKYRFCDEHSTYVAGCRACQAEGRMYNRDYLSDPEHREAKNARLRQRDRSGESRQRSAESKARARKAWEAKQASIPQPNRYQRLTEAEVALVLSDMPAVKVAAIVGRSPQAIHSMRHKIHTQPGWLPGGERGGPTWTTEEDEHLAAMAGMPNKQIAEALGRTYEAVKFRKAHLRRVGLIPPSTRRAAS